MEAISGSNTFTAIDNGRSADLVTDLTILNSPEKSTLQLPLKSNHQTDTDSNGFPPVLSFIEATCYADQGVSAG
jgi:hypothetical protein